MMKKATGLLVVIFFLGCGGAGLKDHLKNGRNYLSIGDGRNAKKEFLKVIEEDPDNCEGNYGLLLADTLNFTEILSLVSGLSSQLMPQQETGTDALIASMLDSLVSSSVDIQRAVKVIEKNKCTYTHLGIPLKLGDTMFYAIGEWREVEAQIISGVADLIAGIFHLLESMNYNFDINSLIEKLGEKYPQPEDLMEDPLGLIRFFGYIPQTSPEFLLLREERKNMWELGREELASALFRVEKALNLLFSPQEGDCPYDNILRWVDQNKDGILDAGDILDARIYTYDPTDENLTIKESERWECDGEPVFEGCLELMEGMCLGDSLVQTFLLSLIDQDYIDNLKSMIHLFGEAITGTYSAPDSITIGILNSLLPEGLEEGISFGGLTIPPLYIKNTLKLHIKEFFDNPVPLRDLLPYYYDENRDGVAEFLIEMEKGAQANISGEYVFEGDTSHFPDKIQFNGQEIELRIEPDGITPPPEGVLIYIALQDPSLNGLLEYNLHEILPNWPDSWTGPNDVSEEEGIFMFNAVLADTLKTIQELLKVITQTL